MNNKRDVIMLFIFNIIFILDLKYQFKLVPLLHVNKT